MADNVTIDNGGLADFDVATDKVTYSGDTNRDVQLIRSTHVTGAEGSKTVQDVTQSTGSAVPAAVLFVGGTDGTNARALKTDAGGELQIDVLTLPALVAGTANIGDVDVLTIAAGDNNIGNVDIVTMPAVTNAGTFAVQENGAALTALQLIDDIIYTDDTSTHATGTSKGALIMAAAVPTDTSVNANDIAAVAMTTDRKLHVAVMDALPAGAANIGDVDVVTVPADPFGVNADAQSASGSISAKLRFIATTGIPVTGTVTVGSHAVTNAGTFVVQENGAALTALQLIDDPVQVLGTDTYTEATSKGITLGAVRRDADTTLVNTTNEFSPLQVDANGRLKVEAFSGETLPVSLTSTTITGTVTVDSELPTAAAISAENTAAPTAPSVYSFPLLFDGANWDRAPGNSADGTLVNLGANNDVTVTSISAGTNNIGDVDVLTVPADPFGVNADAASATGSISAKLRFIAATGIPITSDVPGTGATNSGKAVDSVAGATDTGVAMLAIRDDALTTLTPIDGDYTNLRVNSTGALHVTGGGGGTEYTVNAVAPADPTGSTFVMERDDALSALSEIEGDWTNPRSNANGALWTVLDGSIPAGTNNIGDVDVLTLPALVAGSANIGDVDVLTVPADPFGVNADAQSASGSISAKLRFIATTGIPVTGTVTVGSHAVTNAGTFVVQENGSALTALQLIDDPVQVLGTDTYTEATSKGVTLGAVRRDADTTLVNTTNEFSPLQVDANGRLKVEAFSGETLPVSLTSTTITGTVTVDSELPTAAAISAENTAAPTAPSIYNFPLLFDGTNWDRAPGTSADGALVNLGANNDVTVTSISAGTNNIGDVDVLTLPNVTLAAGTNTNEVVGDVAHDAPVGGNPVLVAGFASAAAPAAVSLDGDAVRAWHLLNGAQATVITAAGALVGGDAANGLDVDVTRLPALVAGTANIGDVDVLTVPADPFGVNADAASATGSISAKLRFIAATGIPITSITAGDNNIGNVDIVTMPNVTLAAGTNTNEFVGDVAHDSPIGGNPVRVGGRGLTADYTAVATGDTTDAITTILGKTITKPFALPGQQWNYAAASGGITNTTAVTIKAAGAAGVRNYLTDLQVINGHATVATEVLIRDGAAGTTIHRGYAAAAGGGYSIAFGSPLRGSTATLLEVVCITSGSAIYVNANGYEGAE